MKSIFRIAVPATINFDVAAESEEQAHAIAVAMVETPVEPMHSERFHVLCYSVWHDETRTPETCDERMPTYERELADIEEEMAAVAAANGNEEELKEALN